MAEQKIISMKHISQHWFTESPIDFEHKQYVLLDFLQSVNEDFKQKKIYPSLNEVIQHLETLENFVAGMNEVNDKMKRLVEFDWTKQIPVYNTPMTNDAYLEQINNIVSFAIPKIRKARTKGTAMFEDLNNQLAWETVGIVPNYVDEGYFIIHLDNKIIYVVQYKIQNIIFEDETYLGINCEIVDSVFSKLKSYEDIKLHMIKKNPELPVPMTFSIQAPDYPLEESLMPVLKRVGMGKIKAVKNI